MGLYDTRMSNLVQQKIGESKGNPQQFFILITLLFLSVHPGRGTYMLLPRFVVARLEFVYSGPLVEENIYVGVSILMCFYLIL